MAMSPCLLSERAHQHLAVRHGLRLRGALSDHGLPFGAPVQQAGVLRIATGEEDRPAGGRPRSDEAAAQVRIGVGPDGRQGVGGPPEVQQSALRGPLVVAEVAREARIARGPARPPAPGGRAA